MVAAGGALQYHSHTATVTADRAAPVSPKEGGGVLFGGKVDLNPKGVSFGEKVDLCTIPYGAFGPKGGLRTPRPPPPRPRASEICPAWHHLVVCRAASRWLIVGPPQARPRPLATLPPEMVRLTTTVTDHLILDRPGTLGRRPDNCCSTWRCRPDN